MNTFLWRLQCRVNWRRGSDLDAAEQPLFDARGESVDVLGGGMRASGSLCVVITTHARPDACARLVDDLEQSLEAAGCADALILVFNDRSPADYSGVLHQLSQRRSGRFAFFESRVWLGKRGFWRIYQAAFRAVGQTDAPLVLFLQDDVVLAPDFVRRVTTCWNAINDPRKAVLSLCALDDDEPSGRWIRFSRREEPGTGARLTQWFDLQAFLAHRRFFEVLHYDVFPMPEARWRRDELLSSGAGEQFTRRLYGRANVYQVAETLVYHGELPSLMNPGARAQRPLRHRRPI